MYIYIYIYLRLDTIISLCWTPIFWKPPQDLPILWSELPVIALWLSHFALRPKLYWIESQQKDADAHTSKRRRIEVMPSTIRRENTFVQIANAAGGLGSAMMNFFTLIISLLPNLGVRIVNIFALATAVLIAIYILLVRGFGDFLVRSTQSVVIGRYSFP